MSALSELQQWYAAQTDEDWEHSYGISIQTLDNPGRSVGIDLTDTLLQNILFEPINFEESETSWMQCQVVNRKFTAFCDPSRLEDVLTHFLDWAKSEPDWLSQPNFAEEEIKTRSDLEFWQLLGDEVCPEQCSAVSCAHLHVKHSMLCRQHHFEMIQRRPCPFD